MKIFESVETENADPERTADFSLSVTALKKISIHVRRIKCSDLSSVRAGKETMDLLSKDGPSSLPITEFDGRIILRGKYPDDQMLVDFLDVPDDILSANKIRLPPNEQSDRYEYRR